MTLPLLLSMALMGATALFPPKGNANGKSLSAKTVGSLLGGLREANNQGFFTGIVMGMGLSWALSYELQRSRLHHKWRIRIMGWLRPSLSSSGSYCEAPKPGETFSIMKNATKQSPQSGNHNNDDQNTVTTIISPDISLTSLLWVSTICLPPGHELALQKATGVELFYVLQGTGEWGSQVRETDEIESNNSTNLSDMSLTRNPIAHGDALIVEASTTRWIANTSTTEDLILLRSSDAGHLHRKKGYDQVVPTSSTSTTSRAAAATSQVSAALTSGMQQMVGYLNSFLVSTS